jgi:hypothetical protein
MERGIIRYSLVYGVVERYAGSIPTRGRLCDLEACCHLDMRDFSKQERYKIRSEAQSNARLLNFDDAVMGNFDD